MNYDRTQPENHAGSWGFVVADGSSTWPYLLRSYHNGNNIIAGDVVIKNNVIDGQARLDPDCGLETYGTGPWNGIAHPLMVVGGNARVVIRGNRISNYYGHGLIAGDLLELGSIEVEANTVTP